MTRFFGKLRKSLFWAILGHFGLTSPFLEKNEFSLMSGQQRKLKNDTQTDNHCFKGPSVYQGLKSSISR